MTLRHYFLMAALLLCGLSSTHAINRTELIKYAQTLKGKKGAELKKAMNPLLAPKTVLPYGSKDKGTWWGFWYTDRNPETNECYNRYSSNKFYFNGHTGMAISGMNIEHSFPKSWWGGSENNAYQDLYNLYPSDSKANSSKSNYAMGVVTNITSEDKGYDKVGSGTIDGQTGVPCWEPGDTYKGDFARSYMYMAIAYSNLKYVKTGKQTMANNDYPGMKSWATTLYIQWSKADKVNDLERARNNAVANIEGNRNLLIDFPHLAEYVWGDSTDIAFNPETSITTADDDNRYLKEPSQPVTPPSEDKYTFELADKIESGKSYLIVAQSESKYIAAKPINSKYGFLYTTDVTVNDQKQITVSSKANAFIITQQSDDKYYIVDSNNQYYYNDNRYQNFNVTSSPSATTLWTLTPNSDGTWKIVSATNHRIQYSSNYHSFGCYSSEQGTMPLLFVETETPTAIQTATLHQRQASDIRYNLGGQRVDEHYKGIVVVNGKKIIVK